MTSDFRGPFTHIVVQLHLIVSLPLEKYNFHFLNRLRRDSSARLGSRVFIRFSLPDYNVRDEDEAGKTQISFDKSS